MSADEMMAEKLAMEAITRKADKTELVWTKIAPVLGEMGMDNADMIVHLAALSGALLSSSTRKPLQLGLLQPLTEEQERAVTALAIAISRMLPHEVGLFMGVLAAAVGERLAEAQAFADLMDAAKGERR